MNYRNIQGYILCKILIGKLNKNIGVRENEGKEKEC